MIFLLASQDAVDGIITYEASIVARDADPKLHERLVRVYPSDGVVTADYPLDLLDEQKHDAYDDRRVPEERRRAEANRRRNLSPPDLDGGRLDVPGDRRGDVVPRVGRRGPAIAAAISQLGPRSGALVLRARQTGSMDNDDGTGRSRIDRVRSTSSPAAIRR